MKIDLNMRENVVSIQNDNDFDILYNFHIYGDDELLYGDKEHSIKRGMSKWHRPNKVFFCYKKIKLKMKNIKKIVNNDHENDPFNEEIWENSLIDMSDIERTWDIIELRKEFV
jgi:hypothetical protein